jgi:hypothetical protein
MADTQLVDPLGRSIVRCDFTWFGHILKGHPEMRVERSRTERAISAPREFRFSSSDVDCRL